jgi:hypothetical protein
VTGPERGYRRLLLAYPAWYRRERGEEILDTLLAAAPRGRTWPSLRDSAALILGGLRVRAGQNRRLTTTANLRLAVLFGVALWLTSQVSVDLAFPGQGWLHWAPFGQPFGYAVARGLAMLAAVGAAWFAPRPVVAAISLIAVAAISLTVARDAHTYQGAWWLLGEPGMLGEPAALAALALLALGKERMPRCWFWLLGLWLLGAELAQALAWLPVRPVFLLSLFGVMDDLPWVILAAVVLWAVVDARPAIAVGVAVVLGRAILLATGWYGNGFGSYHVWFWPLACGAMLALVMTLRLRHQAVL